MASANETSDQSVSEVEKDKREAESQSTHVEDEPLEQDKDANNSTSCDNRRDDHFQGNDSNDKNHNNNNNRGRGGNRRSFWSRGGRGHFKQPHRGGQHQRNSDDGHQEELGHHKTRAHFHGHQRSRGAKFLTVSAASSSRDVQFGNGDQLLIKVDLSQSTVASAGQHQSRQNNHHQQQQQQQKPSINEGESEHSNIQKGSDNRPQGRNGKGSEVRFISTGQSEGNKQEFPPEHKSDHYHHHNYHHRQHPPARGFDHHRRGFRPPRRNGGGRWQRGFLPPRDFGEARGGGEEAFRGMRGFRVPRGGRVFRRRGQNPRGKGFGPSNRDLEVNTQDRAGNEAPPAEDLEPVSREVPENKTEGNSQSVEEGIPEDEVGGDGGSEDLEEDAEAYHDSEDTTQTELDGNPDEPPQTEEKKSKEQGQNPSKSFKDETLEIDKNLAGNFTSALALGGTESKVEALPMSEATRKHETVDAEVAPTQSADSAGAASSSSKMEKDPTSSENDHSQHPASNAGEQKELPKGDKGSEANAPEN